MMMYRRYTTTVRWIWKIKIAGASYIPEILNGGDDAMASMHIDCAIALALPDGLYSPIG